MTKDKIKNLLQAADKTAGGPNLVSVDLFAIRHSVRQRRFASLAIPATAAAVILIALGIWTLMLRSAHTTPEQEKITLLERQVKQLQVRTDATMSLIQEVLEKERRQQRLDELEAELASIPDPIEEMQKQVDKTAFMLVYQADRLYRELNQTDSAVEAYNRVIRLFPENQWAQVARQRIAEIENKKSNKTELKGDFKWKPQNA